MDSVQIRWGTVKTLVALALHCPLSWALPGIVVVVVVVVVVAIFPMVFVVLIGVSPVVAMTWPLAPAIPLQAVAHSGRGGCWVIIVHSPDLLHAVVIC
jgi:hypothetical protein